jgi:hypothetical protein
MALSTTINVTTATQSAAITLPLIIVVPFLAGFCRR